MKIVNFIRRYWVFGLIAAMSSAFVSVICAFPFLCIRPLIESLEKSNISQAIVIPAYVLYYVTSLVLFFPIYGWAFSKKLVPYLNKEFPDKNVVGESDGNVGS